MTPRILPSALCACAAALLLAPCARAEELGRLFFTPEQRATLERGRRLPQPERADKTPLRVDGIVLRSAGKGTVWINGVPRDDDSAAPDRVRIDRRNPAQVSIGATSPIVLKVGAALDRATGASDDGLAGGRVGAGSPAAPRR